MMVASDRRLCIFAKMNFDLHPLEKPFGHIPFVLKSLGVFAACFGFSELLAPYSSWVRGGKELLAKHDNSIFALLFGFVAVHLVYEVILRHFRLQIERTRTDPEVPRIERKANRKRKTDH
jgi:hypothetical protein